MVLMLALHEHGLARTWNDQAAMIYGGVNSHA